MFLLADTISLISRSLGSFLYSPYISLMLSPIFLMIDVTSNQRSYPDVFPHPSLWIPFFLWWDHLPYRKGLPFICPALCLFSVYLLSTCCMLVLGLTDQGRRGAISAHTELSFYSAELKNRQRSKCIIRNCDDGTKHKNLGGNLQRSLRGGDIEANPEREARSNCGGKQGSQAERTS